MPKGDTFGTTPTTMFITTAIVTASSSISLTHFKTSLDIFLFIKKRSSIVSEMAKWEERTGVHQIEIGKAL